MNFPDIWINSGYSRWTLIPERDNDQRYIHESKVPVSCGGTMDEIPDFARGFCAGRKSVLRTNLSGCACMWDDKDEEVIVSVRAAHKDMIKQRVSDYIHKSKVPVSCGGTMEGEMNDEQIRLEYLRATDPTQKF